MFEDSNLLILEDNGGSSSSNFDFLFSPDFILDLNELITVNAGILIGENIAMDPSPGGKGIGFILHIFPLNSIPFVGE